MLTFPTILRFPLSFSISFSLSRSIQGKRSIKTTSMTTNANVLLCVFPPRLSLHGRSPAISSRCRRRRRGGVGGGGYVHRANSVRSSSGMQLAEFSRCNNNEFPLITVAPLYRRSLTIFTGRAKWKRSGAIKRSNLRAHTNSRDRRRSVAELSCCRRRCSSGAWLNHVRFMFLLPFSSPALLFLSSI